jgi:GAF domain-containing protein
MADTAGMTPQAEDSARLQELLGDLYAERKQRAETQSAVIDVILARLRCARISMWKFDGSGDDLTLLCFASKTAGGVLDTSERRLLRPEFIDYFNALVDAGTYVSVDAMNDPVLQPMRASYLVPNNVVSMLDAAFVLNNQTYGMVCCEENHRREWKASDVVSLRAIVNKIALLMWNAPDTVLLRTPSLPLRMLLQEPGPPVERRR